MSTKWSPINSFFTSIILIFHQYFGIQDTLLSLNPSGLHFVHPGLECGSLGRGRGWGALFGKVTLLSW